ncbi:MAG: agmatine deiminase family protein [Thermoplasmatales archaeon]|nr:MAG: agmatine deiminase family protein [Thermoplasmatales archaeon]
MKKINMKIATRIIATFLIIMQVITSGFVSATEDEESIVGIRYAQWDESDHYNSSTGLANSESYADTNIGFFTGTHTLGQSGFGQAEGYIKHWVEWNCPIEDNDGIIKIYYDYGIISLLQKGIGSGMAHAKIWLTFFIDDSQHEVTIFDKTIQGLDLPDFSLEVSENETWSKTLELTQKIYTIGVQTNFELEFTGKGKADVGFAIDHINNQTTLVEITWTATSEQRTTEAVNAFYASFEQNIDETQPTFFQQQQISSNKLSHAEFDPVDEMIITWPKKYGDENYEVEPYHVDKVAAAEDAVNVRINVNQFWYWNPVNKPGERWVPPNDHRPIPALQAAGVPLDNVIIEKTMTSSVWVRDYGPHFIIENEKLFIVDFNYLRIFRVLDDIYPTVHGIKNEISPQFIANFFLRHHGGNYISDGEGTAFVCWERLQKDNSKLSQEQVANRLKYFLGLDDVVFLESQVIPVSRKPGEEKYGDQTGHIDMFCKMLDEDTFIVAEWRDGDPWTNDEMAEICDRNAQVLIDIGYEVIRIPTIRNPEDPFVIWSYTNSLIINGVNNKVVLVSEYGAPEDAEVISIYQNAMPDYEIRAIDSTEIIKFYGAMHCTTMTRPLVSSGGGGSSSSSGSTVFIEVHDIVDSTFIVNALVALGTEEEIWRFQSTDQYGVARFNNVPDGTYTLEVSASGYLNTTASVFVQGPEATTETIYLTTD